MKKMFWLKATLFLLNLTVTAMASDFPSQQLIKPESDQDSMMFGGSLAISQGTVAISGMNADVLASGNHRAKKHAGEVYVYTFDGGSWNKEATLRATDASTNDNFGFSIDIDQSTIVVGAWHADVGKVHDAGAAYVFQKQSDGSWKEVQRLIASTPMDGGHFGASVAIEGNLILVGAQRQYVSGYKDAGSAFVFEKSIDDSWNFIQTLMSTAPEEGELFGRSVGIGGGQMFVSSPMSSVGEYSRAGLVRVYEYEPVLEGWVLAQTLSAGDAASADLFGEHMSFSDSTLAVGAWHEDEKGGNAGAVYIFDRVGRTWIESDKLVASNGSDGDRLGFRVGLDGDFLVAGAYRADGYSDTMDTGIAYLFKRRKEQWMEVTKILPENVEGGHFGRSIALDNKHLMIGAEMSGSGLSYYYGLE